MANLDATMLRFKKAATTAPSIVLVAILAAGVAVGMMQAQAAMKMAGRR